jgi:uncharacterized delta-60 repeat protein
MNRTSREGRRYTPASQVENLENRRLLSASAYDASFGVGGKARLDVAGLRDVFQAVYALPDGKLLVAGGSTFAVRDAPPSNDPSHPVPMEDGGVLMRLNADGTPDPSFGAAGVGEFLSDPYGYVPYQELPLHPRMEAITCIAVQADGKILVGSNSFHFHPPAPQYPQVNEDGTPAIVADSSFAVARYNPDGSVDRSFGTDGLAIADMLDYVEGMGEEVRALAVQADGKVVAVGYVGKYNESHRGEQDTSDMGVVRFNPDGSVDETFGRQLINFPRFDADHPRIEGANEVVLQPDGKVLVGGTTGGWAGDRPKSAFALLRLNADGSPDTTFGDGGKLMTPFPMAPDPIDLRGMNDGGSLHHLALLGDGRIVAVGTVASANIALARYTADGRLDPSFGNGGMAVTRGVIEAQYRPTLSPDGTLTVSGVGNGSYYERTPTSAVSRPTGFEAVVARFDGDGRLLASARAQAMAVTGAESVAVMAQAAAVQADGKVVAVGSANPTRWDPIEHLNDPPNSPAEQVHSQAYDGLVLRIDPAQLTPDPSAGRDTGGTGVADGGAVSMPGAVLVRRGKVAKLRLVFASAGAARAAAVTVSGPNGFAGDAQLVKVKSRRRGPAVATFVVNAPGGTFDAGDNGAYAVRLGASPDMATTIGQFTVLAGQVKRRR